MATLIFPSLPARFQSDNDCRPGRMLITSLLFNANSYSVGGSLLPLLGNLQTNNTTGPNTISADIVLKHSGGGVHAFNIAAGGVLRIGGAVVRDFPGAFDTLQKQGGGELVLNGANTYEGETSVSGGTLSFGADNSASSASAVTVAAGATVDLNGHREIIGALAGSGNVLLGNGGKLFTGGNNSSTTFGGMVSGSGFSVLEKEGAGTMTLAGRDSHSGATAVFQGVLRLGAANATSPTSDLQLGGAAFDLNNFNTSVAFLLGNGNVTLGSGTLTLTTFDVGIGFIPFDGIISGMGGLVVTGPNFQTLTGNNTYTGPTTISSGTLVVNGSQPGSNVSISPAGTLAGRGRVGMISALGTVSPGAGNQTAILNGASTIFGGGSHFRVKLRGTVPGTGHDQLNVNGSIDLSGAPALDVALNFASAVGDQFMIMQSTGGSIIGTFAGLPDGQVFALGDARFQISYTPTSVVLTHVADAASQFVVSAPDTATSGSPFDMIVTAVDPGGNVDPLYTGTVTFTTSDIDPGVVLPADYTFTSADAGTHTFTDTGRGETTLITPGDQTISANDMNTGITGSASVTVTTGAMGPAFSVRLATVLPSPEASAQAVRLTDLPIGNSYTVLGKPDEKGVDILRRGATDKAVSQLVVRTSPMSASPTIRPAVDLLFVDDPAFGYFA